MARKAETEKIQPIYQLLFGTPDSNLPPEWSRVDFTSSKNILLYYYQGINVKNIVRKEIYRTKVEGVESNAKALKYSKIKSIRA